MTLVQTILSVILAVIFISAILFVIFGQVTVRKLRKNPETKQVLGIEFASGMDILNAAQALSLPKAIVQKIRANPAGALHADPDLLYMHTTAFDRLLARLFYWSWMSSAFGLIALSMAYFLLDLGGN